MGAPAPQTPTPHPVANPMPAGPKPVANNGPAPAAPHAPVLPSQTPGIVSNAAANMNHSNMQPHTPNSK